MSACRHRRSGAIRMSPCRLRVHPARFPGLLGEHNPLLSPCRVLAVPCLHFSPAAAEAGVRWRRHPRIRQSPACRCRRLLHPAPSLRSVALFLRLSRCDICFRFSPGGRKTGERNPVFNLLHRDGLCRAFTLARPLQMQGCADAAILARSQFFYDARRSSRRFLAQVSLENRPDQLRAISALRPPVSPCIFRFSPGCRVGTAQPGAAVYVITEVYPCSM